MGLFGGESLLSKVGTIRSLANDMKSSDTEDSGRFGLPKGAILLAFVLIGVMLVPRFVALGRKLAGGDKQAANAVVSTAQPSPTKSIVGGFVGVYFSPDTDLESIDVRLLSGAKRTIDAALYSLTDRTVCQVLEKAASSGVRVRVYRDPSQYVEPSDCSKALVESGAQVRVKADGELMHLKSYEVDGKFVRTGSANISFGGEKKQDNDLVVVTDASAISRFSSKFDAMWNREDNR